MTGKLKISAAIATYNEAENIGRCLASVKDWVDEMVVVDGSSQDETRRIAKNCGARVIKTTNKPIFHINKQMAIEACRGDWILQLDADEEVAIKLKDEILKTIKKTDKNGFWLPRKNFFLGRFLTKGGQYPDFTLRLYRRTKGRLPCKSVHEQAEVEGKVGYLKNDLLHWADLSFKRYLLRWRRYTDLMADEMEKEKVKLNVFTAFDYGLLKPLKWFFSTYFRHKGFVDGLPGFIFSFFSGIRFASAYLKYWKKKNASKKS